MEDLGGSDILVVNGDSDGACGVGIESTVAKIDIDNDRIVILRMGGVTTAKLRDTLIGGGDEFSGMMVVAGSAAGGKIIQRRREDHTSDSVPTEASNVESQAPGRSLDRTCLCDGGLRPT